MVRWIVYDGVCVTWVLLKGGPLYTDHVSQGGRLTMAMAPMNFSNL